MHSSRSRILTLTTLIAPALVLGSASVAHAAGDTGSDEPLIIAHRGASGYLPEHTLAAYQLAIEQGADYIEPDLVSTEDGVLVARHENEISGTTDVADHPEFADRKTTKVIDGATITGWFTEDFTLAELKTLRTKERVPDVRPGSAERDGEFEIPTLEEVIALVEKVQETTGRTIGIAPETKHPAYFDEIGLSLEPPAAELLAAHDLDDAGDPVVLQSGDAESLREFDGLVDVELAQLVSSGRGAQNRIPRGELKKIAEYADWLAPEKKLVIPLAADGTLAEPTSLVGDAHRAGLKVVTWTVRGENRYLPDEFDSSAEPNAIGDLHGEVTALLDAGVDAIFSDHPDLTVAARDDYVD